MVLHTIRRNKDALCSISKRSNGHIITGATICWGDDFIGTARSVSSASHSHQSDNGELTEESSFGRKSTKNFAMVVKE